MLKIVRERIKDLENHISYLEANQSELIETKYGRSYVQWEEQLNITNSKAEELKNCLKIYNKANKTRW